MEFRVLGTQILRATLCEIERGLFHVSYRTDSADADVSDLPRYQVASSASVARQRIEEQAHSCGFIEVVWDYAPVVTTRLSGSAGDIPPAGLSTGRY
jgi:hypothetical protein